MRSSCRHCHFTGGRHTLTSSLDNWGPHLADRITTQVMFNQSMPGVEDHRVILCCIANLASTYLPVHDRVLQTRRSIKPYSTTSEVESRSKYRVGGTDETGSHHPHSHCTRTPANPISPCWEPKSLLLDETPPYHLGFTFQSTPRFDGGV